MRCSLVISRKMKETILQFRLIQLEGTLSYLCKGKHKQIKRAIEDYAKDTRATFDDEKEFNRWCRQALGLDPDNLLKGKELTLKQLIDRVNELQDKAIKTIEEAIGTKFEKIPIHVSKDSIP